MVIDKETNVIQHYVEKPSTFVSTIVNCGVYLCSPQIFDIMTEIHSEISNINRINQQYTSTRYIVQCKFKILETYNID